MVIEAYPVSIACNNWLLIGLFILVSHHLKELFTNEEQEIS